MISLNFVDLGKNNESIIKYLKTIYPPHMIYHPIAINEIQFKIKDFQKKIHYIYNNSIDFLNKYFPEFESSLKQIKLNYSFDDVANLLQTMKDKIKQYSDYSNDKEQIQNNNIFSIPKAYVKLGTKLYNYLDLLNTKLTNNIIKYFNLNNLNNTENMDKNFIHKIINELNVIVMTLNQNYYNRIYGVSNDISIYITDLFFKSNLSNKQKMIFLAHELFHIKHNIFGYTIEHLIDKIKNMLINNNKIVEYLIYSIYLNTYLNIIADFFANKDIYYNLKNNNYNDDYKHLFSEFLVDKQFMIKFVINGPELYEDENLNFPKFLEKFYEYITESKITSFKNLDSYETDLSKFYNMYINNKQNKILFDKFNFISNSCFYNTNNVISLVNDLIYKIYFIYITLIKLNKEKFQDKNLDYNINKSKNHLLYHINYIMNKYKYYVYKEYSKYFNEYTQFINSDLNEVKTETTVDKEIPNINIENIDSFFNID
ncbi:hypothetical protein DEFDS_P195 (plasmid) [Deferribacter desulfuricans SSM1]|uniref:Uncharacterized protein n=1 Tax=Deferribacter desulfuricans (strain DSM 14783 / JCM 11476 / NBRC 101012 / SSM1) TaxID=639282 RepID=D3PF23_DEFDS|nr:hypothetical protein [Deferribacter desulfuricans]BAI81815.1 hypothetical protein DEFDS_P195 [Deferribacter desulfuricans SSM1]